MSNNYSWTAKKITCIRNGQVVTSTLTTSNNIPAQPSQPNSNQPPSIDHKKFEQECLDEHNRLRAYHGCPPLVLSRKLCSYAQEWANNISSRNVLQHRPERRYGENLFHSYGSAVNGATAVKSWYDEIENYTFGCGGFSSNTGHFTQVIWKNSKQLGCAVKTNSKGAAYVVANYDPHGNVAGQFPENVPPPQP